MLYQLSYVRAWLMVSRGSQRIRAGVGSPKSLDFGGPGPLDRGIDRSRGADYHVAMARTRLHHFLTRESGQTMAEYGIVLAVITLALLAAFGLLAGEIETSIERVRAII